MGSFIPKASSTQLEFRRGTSQVTYATMVPRGTRRCVSCLTCCIPVSAYFTLKLQLSSAKVLLYSLVVTSSPLLTSARDSLGWITHECQSIGTQGHSQSAIDAVSRYSENHGYIHNPGRSQICLGVCDQ